MMKEIDSADYYGIVLNPAYLSLAKDAAHTVIQQLNSGTQKQGRDGKNLQRYLQEPRAFEVMAFFGFLFAHREEKIQFSMDAVAVFTRHSLTKHCGPLKHAISALDEGDFKKTLSIPMQRFIDLLQN